MKRFLSVLIMGCVLSVMAVCPASAADTSRSYEFNLSCNGERQIKASPGDIITVTLMLNRTDSQQASVIYGLQDEIRYDDEFFEIIDGRTMVAQGFVTNDISLRGGDRAMYVNYISLSGGEEWPPEIMAAVFQVKILGRNGVSVMKNENCTVSVKDGTDSYAYSVQDLTVLVSDECTVRFDTMDGGDVIEQTASVGAKLTPPQNISRDGYRLAGWYRDVDHIVRWDFDKDTVRQNMTLYALWEADDGTVQAGTGDNTDQRMYLIGVIPAAILFVFVISKRKKKDD